MSTPYSFKYLSFNIATYILLLLTISFALSKPPDISSFQELGKFHCENFPINTLYRLSSGQLAEQYGSKYAKLDCYIRQFVNKDGQNLHGEQQSDESDEEAEGQEAEENLQSFPQKDPIVVEFAKGVKQCLPSGVDQVEAVYQIWRLYRYVIQHDYAFEWMRAKIRSGLGYEAQRPNSWMDGQQGAERLRLDKLFSNEFYDYVDKLMFRDFLYPFMTFMKKNVVVGLEAKVTTSGKPILMQYIQTRNILQTTFLPIRFKSPQVNIFTYTIPGIPLLLGGSTGEFSWAFTGVLVDRSNVEQIQTVGNKFYHHGIEEWVKLNNITDQIKVKDSTQQPQICSYMHSSYGTLYTKHNRTGKISEYIARWHEDQNNVRNLFTNTYNLILAKGHLERDFDFPFNSIVMANATGIFNYICPQHHPSYFIYPDLTSEPDPMPSRWVSEPKRGIYIVANTHLTTIHQQDYLKKELLSSIEDQLTIDLRKLIGKETISKLGLWEAVLTSATDPLVKKRKQHFIFMYRKSKYVFFPEQTIRKECDQLITIVQKWDHTYNQQLHSPVFILWDYFLRQFTLNHISSSEYGAAIAKHRVMTDSYWTSQPELWKKGISYGECDTHLWTEQGWDVTLNNSGLNSTCFFNINRALNKTREILRNEDGTINQTIRLSDFWEKKVIDLTEDYKGSHIDEAFNNYYSRNVAWISEIGEIQMVYLEGYEEKKQQFDLQQYDRLFELEAENNMEDL